MPNKKSETTYYLYGKHTCLSALQNPLRKIHKIFVSPKLENNIPNKFREITKILSIKEIENILPKGSLHQGIALLASPTTKYQLNNINLEEVKRIAILDQITDPHNFGAIIRSAAAFDIEVVIYPKDHSPNENSIIAKTSSGGLDQVKLAQVTNISSAILELKKKNFWIIGLGGDSKELLTPEKTRGKIAIALGSEGKGLRRLTRNNCDEILKIPMSHKMESLNVSVAASISFFQAYLENFN